MATTYTLISSNVLASSAASVTFSAIPATYTDLVLRYSVRSSSAGTHQQEMFISLNGATSGTTTSQTDLYASSSTIASSRFNTSYPGFKWMNIYEPGNSATSNTFNNAEVYFTNYAGSNQKVASSFYVSENNTSTDFQSWIGVNALKSTITTAISSITLGNQAGDFVSGSSFYLYGISNS